MDARTFFYQLGKMIYQIDGAYEAYGKNFKIGSSNLLWILYALNDGKRHSQKQICNDWAIPRSTANTIIKELEGKNYLSLSQMKGERRELEIALTPLGKRYAERILSDLYERERAVFSKIQDPEKLLCEFSDLSALLQEISKNA